MREIFSILLRKKSATAVQQSRNTEDKIKLLADMFPDASKLRVKKCLSDSSGDVEQAVQALLHSESHKTREGSLTTPDKIVSSIFFMLFSAHP